MKGVTKSGTACTGLGEERIARRKLFESLRIVANLEIQIFPANPPSAFAEVSLF